MPLEERAVQAQAPEVDCRAAHDFAGRAVRVLAFVARGWAGAMAAISAALEPEMPDTRYIAPIST
mgnify:CR=1 FL=1